MVDDFAHGISTAHQIGRRELAFEDRILRMVMASPEIGRGGRAFSCATVRVIQEIPLWIALKFIVMRGRTRAV